MYIWKLNSERQCNPAKNRKKKILRNWQDFNHEMSLYMYLQSALNMLTKILHNELKDKGIHVGCLHPGWVQTDMGTAKAPVTVSQSVCGCIQVMSNMNAENACVFTDYTGNPLPWWHLNRTGIIIYIYRFSWVKISNWQSHYSEFIIEW